MGCAFSLSQGVRSFTPLLSEDNDKSAAKQTKQKNKLSKRLRQTSVKFKKMENKTSLYLPCGCQNKSTKKANDPPTIEEAVRMRDKALLLNLMLNSEEETGWAALDIKKRQCDKNNPVELACQLGFADIVKVFLDNGCSPNLPTKTGRLIHSVLESMKSSKLDINDGYELVESLLDGRCDVNMKDTKGTTTLLYCAELGNEQIMRLILPFVSDNQFTTRCGGSQYTPLHMAVMKGEFDIVKLLLDKNPQRHINIQDVYGNTPLLLTLQSMLNTCSSKYPSVSLDKTVNTEHLVFRYTSIAIIETLLNSGADPNISKLNEQQRLTLAVNFHNNTSISFALQLTMLGMESAHPKSSVMLNKLYNLSQIAVYNDSFRDVNHVLHEENSRINSTSDSSDNLLNIVAEETEEENELTSPYAGVVRLLVQAGFNLTVISQESLCALYPPVKSLIVEMYDYRSRYFYEKPPRLVDITKQMIRKHLASVKRLHLIDTLPLPVRVRDYICLKTL